jgi:hypothetical protein
VYGLHRKILADFEGGLCLSHDLGPEVHPEAGRLWLAPAAEALHPDRASLPDAAAIVTYDQRLAEAAIKTGLNSLPWVARSNPIGATSGFWS